MGKVKIKRKSTLIDMTAMSDVTVLLLTFFMLTSTFLQKEPVTVVTPASVSEIKVPTANVAQILVSPEGKVFFSIAGEAEVGEGKNPVEWGTEPLRASILKSAVAEWNELNPSKKVTLTQSRIDAFSKIGMFGVPFTQLEKFLDMKPSDQDEYMKDLSKPGVGIPVNDNKNVARPNEFQIWLKAIRDNENSNFYDLIRSGEGVAVKADRTTPYETVHDVLDNLQTMKMNRFSLMTALKTEQD